MEERNTTSLDEAMQLLKKAAHDDKENIYYEYLHKLELEQIGKKEKRVYEIYEELWTTIGRHINQFYKL